MDHKKGFIDILNIARQNAVRTPSIVGAETMSVVQRYMSELTSEIDEVKRELKENNEIFLTDELSDIAWDYANLLSILEHRTLIANAEDVLEHGFRKYTERAPAFLEKTPDMWDAVKQKQKEELEKEHTKRYGV